GGASNDPCRGSRRGGGSEGTLAPSSCACPCSVGNAFNLSPSGESIRPPPSRTRSLALGGPRTPHQPNRPAAHDQPEDGRCPLAFDLQQACGHLARGCDSFGP